MIINTNMSAVRSNRLLTMRDMGLQKTLRTLSSGKRINVAADDAAGLAVSEKISAKLRSLKVASRNIGDGISLIQTAEGYLHEAHNIANRLRELSTQSANGIYSDQDREQIQFEVTQLLEETDDIANRAEFNGNKLFDGRYSRTEGETVPTDKLVFQVGYSAEQNVRVYLSSITNKEMGLENLSVTTVDNSRRAINQVDNAIEVISLNRNSLGAYQSRLERTLKNVNLATENLTAAKSQIVDANIAEEVVNLTRANILSQANISMLAQANVSKQAVLKLIS